MLHFWYTKFLMTFVPIIAFISFLGALYFAFYTTTNYEPIGNQAPFIETMGLDVVSVPYLEQKQAITLEEPHRTSKEMQIWVTGVIGDSLFFRSGQLAQTIPQNRKFFTEEGFSQYETYLRESGIQSNVDENGYDVNVYVEQQPLLLNSGAIDNVYRWLYQLPITMTFLPKNTVNLLGQQNNMFNQKVTVRIQLRRVLDDNALEGLQIESWNIRARR
ncbi:MAG: DotI/IcmL/TraM family protein [Pseudomonadota bacterium]